MQVVSFPHKQTLKAWRGILSPLVRQLWRDLPDDATAPAIICGPYRFYAQRIYRRNCAGPAWYPEITCERQDKAMYAYGGTLNDVTRAMVQIYREQRQIAFLTTPWFN